MSHIRAIAKNFFGNLPLPVRRLIVWGRDYGWYWYCVMWEMTQAFPTIKLTPQKKQRKRVLIYALYGLRHAGTERNLQLIANSLTAEYDVYYMYGEEPESAARASVLHGSITLIPFTYTKNELAVPHRLTDMAPRLTDVIKQYEIDCLITASPGYSHYPWNMVRDIPIVLLNIFGAPTLQPNVKKVIYNSPTTRTHAERWIGPDLRGEVAYAPLLTTPPENTRVLGANLRARLGISKIDMVFGRIGRDDDGIFDPIGIRAWQQIAEQYPHAHYLIMSPPPALRKIVEHEQIPRVHLLPPSSREDDVWAFHGAIDAMAHFRFDGETSGVAIAESLTLGNPVISHRSHLWNAHAGYLSDPYGIVVAQHSVEEYASAMERFLHDHSHHQKNWQARKENAETVGKNHFNSENYALFIRRLIADTLKK